MPAKKPQKSKSCAGCGGGGECPHHPTRNPQRVGRRLRTDQKVAAPTIIEHGPDWKRGMLVRRSDHQLRENPATKPALGIVVNTTRIGGDKPGTLVTYPFVHWQDQPTDSLTHPDNATPVSVEEVAALYSCARARTDALSDQWVVDVVVHRDHPALYHTAKSVARSRGARHDTAIDLSPEHDRAAFFVTGEDAANRLAEALRVTGLKVHTPEPVE